MSTHAIYLPWPPACLNPNSRGHWASLAKAKAVYRKECFATAKTSGLGKIDARALHVAITFHPPNRRPRDLDNMLASIKSGLDGVADACGVDDSLWSLSLCKGGALPTSGHVKVELSWGPKDGES